MPRPRLLLLALLASLAGAPVATAADAPRPDTLFAAASLSVVLDELVPAYHAATGRELRISYAASGTLARQIEQGAPADAFISADTTWMDYLGARHLVAEGSRFDLLGNRLVLVAAAGNDLALPIGRGFGIGAALKGGRLAIGDPDSVPAGRYARAALQSLGAWDQVADHLALGDSVRVALQFVERGEAPLGIVYRTDARDDARVRIVGEFPPGSHPDITYPAALTRGHQPGSEALPAFLRGPEARAAFERHGFVLPD